MYKCDECGCTCQDQEPEGWLLLVSHGTGLSTELEHCYCPECKEYILIALGFNTEKDYLSMVKAIAEMERKHEASARPPSVEEQVPFYLFDEEWDWE